MYCTELPSISAGWLKLTISRKLIKSFTVNELAMIYRSSLHQKWKGNESLFPKWFDFDSNVMSPFLKVQLVQLNLVVTLGKRLLTLQLPGGPVFYLKIGTPARHLLFCDSM